jgi:hypothetical protein
MTSTNKDIQIIKLTADSISKRTVFFIFCHPHYLKTFLLPLTSGTLGFAARQKANTQAKPKEPLFCIRSILFSTFRINYKTI